MRLEQEDGTPTPQALWMVLDKQEATGLMVALQLFFEEMAEGQSDPGWHHHVGEGDCELTIAIDLCETMNSEQIRG